MDNTYSVARRALSAVVATLTILWAAGAAAFAVPQMASAATAGDLIRGTSFSTVYFYGYDGSRYVFPNEKTYDTWFNGFSSVSTISDSAVAAIPVASSNVVYRPGSRFIKVTTVPDTFAVGRDGMIHWIETQEVATGLAGSDWNQNIDDVADAFFDNYTEGVSLTSAAVWDGALYMDGADYFVAWDGAKHKLSAAARTANNLENRFFLDGASINDSSLDAGDDFTGFVCALADASQSGNCVSTPVGGNLSVSLASTTPASANIPDAANHVVATTWKLTADQATDLSALTVSYNGLAATSDIETVYLYEGDARLDNGRSVNSSTRTATFAGLNLHFSAGQTRYVSAVVDMADAGQNGTFRFGIAGSSSVVTNGTAAGSFPLWGNTHTIINASVGAVTVDQNGSQNNTAAVGEAAVAIGRFSVQASSSEDVKLNALTLTVDGDVNANELTDYALYQSGTKVATGAYLRKDLVLFSFTTPFSIAKGDTRNFEARATVTGTNGDVINTYVKSESDVNATGVNTGFGVSANILGYDGAAEKTVTTLEGGTVTLASKTPAAQDVRNNANDHKFLDFTVTSSEATTVNSVSATIVGTDLYDGGWALTDLRLINVKTGTLLSSVEITGGDSNTKTVVFGDEFSMKAGETLELAVTADLEEAVVEANDTIKISLAAASDLSLEDVNGDAITDIIPSSGVSGKNQTVIDSGLTVSLAGSPNGDKTVVRGAQDITPVRYNFSAADGGDIKVTDLTLNIYSNDTGTLSGTTQALDARDYIETCSLYEGTTLVDGPVSPETNETLLFNNFSWTIKGGMDTTLSVVCDLVDTAPAADAELAIAIANASDVEAIDDNQDTVNVSGTANAASATKISVENTGGLVASVSSSTPDEAFVLTGSVDQAVSTFRFDASNENFNVNNLTFVEVGGGNAGVESVSITYPTNSAGTTATRSVSLVGNTASFTNIGMFVKQNVPAYVTVKANIADTSRNNGDAISNTYVKFELGDNTDEFEATGVASSELVTDVVAGTVTTSAERRVVRETIPTVTKAAASASGALFNGDSPVYMFNVGASSGEDVIMDGVTFALSGSGDWNYCASDDGNLTTDDLSIDRVVGTGHTTLTDVTWTLLDSSGAEVDPTNCTAATVKFVKLDFTDGSGEVVAAGTTRSYELSINVRGAVSGDSLQVSIPAETSLPTAAAVTDLTEDLDATETLVSVADGSGFAMGTVAIIGTEKMLVTEVDGNDLTVVRGYAGTTAATHLDATVGPNDVSVTLTSFLWQDDGTRDRTDNASNEAFWGASLVQSLPARGNTLVW